MNTSGENIKEASSQQVEGELFKIYPSVTFRRVLFWGTVFVLALLAVFLMGDLAWRAGLHRAHFLLILAYTVLNGFLTIGFVHALYGSVLSVLEVKRGLSITKVLGNEEPVLKHRYAVVMPVYNEEPFGVSARIEAMYGSIKKTGCLELFDFYILSDSTSLERWLQEEAVWVNLCRKLDAFGRLFYRRRANNENRKAGNISDFVRKWGAHYEGMLVLDADSLMDGADILKMARVMEKYPRLGILQTPPRLIRGESLFSRMQQFAMSLYGPLFVRGLNFWQLGSGTYWGHNAMIRVKPFSQYCELPALPGREPFGGRILSHDFVEASLMVREGWEVWLAWDIAGTYEEAPPSLVDHLKRDRRWCQGNFQHTWLLFARKLPLIARTHLSMGIMAYLSSPLLAFFILLSLWISWDWETSGLSKLPINGICGEWLGWSYSQQSIILTIWTLTLLFFPKVLAWVGVMVSQQRREAFGGGVRLTISVFLETLVSMLIAPVVMVYHSVMIAGLILGLKVNWVTQNRATEGTSWREACFAHGFGTLVGIVGTVFLSNEGAVVGLWMAPLLGGLLLSIPVSVLTSKSGPSERMKDLKLCCSPEDIRVPEVVASMEQILQKSVYKFPSEGFRQSAIISVIVDPYINAIHLSLLDFSEKEPQMALVEKWLKDGNSALTNEEMKIMLYHHASLLVMHRNVWIRPFEQLHEQWVQSVESYRLRSAVG